MRQLFAAVDKLGNLPVQPEIYPDQIAPIVRMGADGERELVKARWGLPSPPSVLKSARDPGVTNVRNTGSPHWRRWLGPANRCLVPLTAFAEPLGKGQGNQWFAPPERRPAAFAGIHVPGWTSVRKIKDGATTDDQFAFLTTSPNAEVASVHHKAMPVILTEPAEWLMWMSSPWSEARLLQRPLADGTLELLQGPA